MGLEVSCLYFSLIMKIWFVTGPCGTIICYHCVSRGFINSFHYLQVLLKPPRVLAPKHFIFVDVVRLFGCVSELQTSSPVVSSLLFLLLLVQLACWFSSNWQTSSTETLLPGSSGSLSIFTDFVIRSESLIFSTYVLNACPTKSFTSSPCLA